MALAVYRSGDVNMKSEPDLKKICLGDPVKIAVGGGMIPVLYGEKKEPLVMLLPPLQLPFEASVFRNEKRPAAVSVLLDFRHAVRNKQIYETLKFFQKLDAYVQKLIVSERERVLPQLKKFTHTDEQIKQSYKPLTAPRTSASSENAYPPAISTKVKQTGEQRTLAMPHSSEADPSKPIDISDESVLSSYFSKGQWLRTLLICNGLYVRDGRIHLTWRMLQCRVEDEPTLTEGLFEPTETYGFNTQAPTYGMDFNNEVPML